MTRFLTTTILSAALATSAMALTEREETVINRYVPDANLSIYSDTTIASVMNIVNNGESHGEKAAKVRALLKMPAAETPAVITESEFVILSRHMDEALIPTLTESEKLAVLNVINAGGSEGELQAKVDALVLSDARDYPGNDATQGEEILIRFYAPELAVDTLTQDELQQVLLAINSEDSRADIRSRIEQIAGS